MFEFESKVYDKVPETRACEGCAFRKSAFGEQTDGCKVAPDCIGHIFVERKAPAPDEREATAKPDANGWIPWGGGECPVPPDSSVEYVLRDGSRYLRRADILYWDHLYRETDIVKYRVVPPPPDEHEALTFHELPTDSKPTNPKDIVGIRKAPMSTVSGPVIAELGVAMLEGAAKYGRHNYRVVGVRSSVYYDALFRHIQAWWEGEDIDPDSGMHHVTKAIATLVVLRDAMIQGKCEDDRPPPSVEFFARLNKLSGEILDRHKDKAPKHYTIQDTV